MSSRCRAERSKRKTENAMYLWSRAEWARLRLEKREIQVGIADTTNFEVLSGLQSDEVVALPGDVDLKDGMLVKVVNMDNSNIKGEKDAGL